MLTSENINEISKAMSTAQGEMNPASKSTVNPFFKSTYSNLTQVWDAIREPLSKNNLALFQDVISTSVGISVTTRVTHASGQWMEFGPLEIALTKRDAQALGSATSYAKRYALCAAVGVVSGEDDDGEAAMDRNQSQPKQQQQHQKKSPAQLVAESPELSDFKKFISEEEGKELGKLMAQCTQQYQDDVWKFLTEAKVYCYEEMTPLLYNKIKSRTLNELKGK